jgi:hypothetical protein
LFHVDAPSLSAISATGRAELKCRQPLGISQSHAPAKSAPGAAREEQGLQCAVQDADQQEFLGAKQPKKLDKFFPDTLKDIYFPEKKTLATLPKMAKAAQSPDPKKAFEKHRVETTGSSARRCLRPYEW